MRLGQLDNRKDEFGAPLVHREKVRRLQRSLVAPKSFPALNPEELERVATALAFTPDERVRLYAAVLATAVEVTLMDRIAPESALQAAEQILPVLRQAMAETSKDGALRAVRGGGNRMGESDDRDATDLDRRFEKALDALDRGTLDLHLARSTGRYQEQIEHAQQAHERFQTAVRLFETASDMERKSESWRVWHGEAQHGAETAASMLARFGKSVQDSR
jgi:hypothetical protein